MMTSFALNMTTASLTVRKGGRRVACNRDVKLFGQRMTDISRRVEKALRQSDTYKVLTGASR